MHRDKHSVTEAARTPVPDRQSVAGIAAGRRQSVYCDSGVMVTLRGPGHASGYQFEASR